MKRREFIALVGSALAWSQAHAQQRPNIPAIGYLGLVATGPSLEAFLQGLREHGYAEGQNIVIHYRWANGRIEAFPSLATELVALKVDLIVAAATPAARAALQATNTIPIVSPNMGDPVADGLVTSLARPGGNLTGSTFLGPELVPKRLELLKEALPKASHVAILWHPNAFPERTMREMLAGTEAAARAQGLQSQFLEVRGADEFERAFSAITRADALLVFPSVMLFNERVRISDLAAKHRLPTISAAREFAELGGLISSGASIGESMRRAATYVDKILKGAKPSELPVEQPTKFELIINLKTAKMLGLSIPPVLLARADEVIE